MMGLFTIWKDEIQAVKKAGKTKVYVVPRIYD